MCKAPQSILVQILEETFNNLEKGEDFEDKTVEKLRKLADNESLSNKRELILILEEGSGENPQTDD